MGLLLTAAGQLVPQAPGREVCPESCTFLTRLRVTGKEVAEVSLGWVGTINFPNTARNQAHCPMMILGAVTTMGGVCMRMHTLVCAHTSKEIGAKRGGKEWERQTDERRKEVLRRLQGS